MITQRLEAFGYGVFAVALLDRVAGAELQEEAPAQVERWFRAGAGLR